jgi:pimeloyl-ACP methyl ester carboxylesterase
VAWRVDRQRLEALHQNTEAVDLWHTLADGPTRCIRGAHSTFVDDLAAERMLDAGCRVDTVPAAGHFVHVEKPAELLRLLTA